MSVFKNKEQLEKVFGALFDRIMNDPEMMKDLRAADLKLRFRYHDPDAVATIDFTASPPEYSFTDKGQADVEMMQSADVSHLFWLGRLSAVRAIATGKVVARGNVTKAMKLLPAIRPAFALYKDVLCGLGLEELIPKEKQKLRKTKSAGWLVKWMQKRSTVDYALLPEDTKPEILDTQKTITINFKNFALPDERDARRLEMLRRMCLIRAFEEGISREWENGKIKTAAIHLCIGQEAVAVGVCGALRADDCITTTHRGHGHMIAKGASLKGMLADIYGKAEGLCHGKGGSMHVTDASAGALGANGIVGASALLAAGAAVAFNYKKENRVAAAFLGEGAMSQGMVHEAMNLSSLWNLPVLFIVENNAYCGFSPRAAHMKVERVSDRAAAYAMRASTVNGNCVEEVYEAVKNEVKKIREGQGPALLECVTYRWHGHMEGDTQEYRSCEEVEEWKSQCPIQRLSRTLTDEGKLSLQKAGLFKADTEKEIAEGIRYAETCSEPPVSFCRSEVFAPERPLPPSSPGVKTLPMTGAMAIRQALSEEMRNDKNVILLGEDVSSGGYMGVTSGLRDEFGRDRVIDTPISEYAIAGAAVGAAMQGLRPIAELMFSDFITCAMDPIVNQAAKLRYMSGGQYSIPLVVRLPGGAGLGLAAQHSQSMESLLMGVPGLIIAAPSSPRDCRAMLKAAIRSNNTVLFFEHKLLYLSEDDVPEGEEWLPLGKASVKRTGKDVTVVSLLYTVGLCLEAGEILSEHGIEIEVIDLLSLSPLDTETVLRSVEKTGRLITVEEGPLRGGWGAEVVARVASCAHSLLKSAPLRIGGPDNPIPYNRALENACMPCVDDIVSMIKRKI